MILYNNRITPLIVVFSKTQINTISSSCVKTHRRLSSARARIVSITSLHLFYLELVVLGQSPNNIQLAVTRKVAEMNDDGDIVGVDV